MKLSMIVRSMTYRRWTQAPSQFPAFPIQRLVTRFRTLKKKNLIRIFAFSLFKELLDPYFFGPSKKGGGAGLKKMESVCCFCDHIQISARYMPRINFSQISSLVYSQFLCFGSSNFFLYYWYYIIDITTYSSCKIIFRLDGWLYFLAIETGFF